MRFDIMTLFPEAVSPMLNASILGRAQKKGLIEIHAHQIRDYTANRQNQVDDYPYGGGRGAIMQCDPLWRCWCAVCDEIGGAKDARAVLSAANHGVPLVATAHADTVAGLLRRADIRALHRAGVFGAYVGIERAKEAGFSYRITLQEEVRLDNA